MQRNVQRVSVVSSGVVLALALALACFGCGGDAVCGDGVVAGFEECDDGNRDNDDGCLVDCRLARCGDGYVYADGGEECDDGNQNNRDQCPGSCRPARCGDGFTHDEDGGAEECDDGNQSDRDACLNSCLRASCGDGFVYDEGAGTEECDDGNTDDSDDCVATCRAARCGDGHVHGDAEQCDDGNTLDDDGCSDLCMIEGVLYFSLDNQPGGLHRLDTSSGAAVKLGLSGVDGGTHGMAYDPAADLLYVSKPYGLMHVRRDGSSSIDRGGEAAEGLAYDPGRQILYAAINGSFSILDTDDGSLVATLPGPGFDVEGLAVDPATGTVYGVGDSRSLAAYDPDAATWTIVGDTGINWNDGGLAFHPGSGLLYVCGQGGDTRLYTIDPETAAPTLVGDFDITLVGSLALAFDVTP